MGTDAPGERRQGWVDFAGFLLAIAGMFQVIYGAVLLDDPAESPVGGILYWNVESWGWGFLLVGVALLATAWFVFQGNPFAEMFAIFAVVVGMFIQASTFRYAPEWSLILIVLGMVVIYGLVVHGDIRATVDRI